ncbi:MAG: cytochrome c [Rhodocyclaceae bacterium]|nr:cytochrome c [Rhodocyclaceae bacterium]
MKLKLTLALAAAALTALATTSAYAQISAEDQITFRQSGYKFMAWNMGRIKANLDGAFNKDQVRAAANVIAATSHSGMGTLFGPGTDKGIGWEPTRVKPELFKQGAEVKKLAGNFAAAADEMVKAAGDQATAKAAFGKLGETCKACHDKFREKE